MKKMKKEVVKKKVMVVKNFSARGERYRKGMIVKMTDEEIRRYKEEGFVDDVAKVLGVECGDGSVDLSGYAKKEHEHAEYLTQAQIEELKPTLKGDKGDKGDTGQSGANGVDGKSIEIQKTATHIQWRQTGGNWTNLIALSDLKGATGAKGDKGDAGFPSEQQWNELVARVAALEGGAGASVQSELEESPAPKKRKTTKKA